MQTFKGRLPLPFTGFTVFSAYRSGVLAARANVGKRYSSDNVPMARSGPESGSPLARKTSIVTAGKDGTATHVRCDSAVSALREQEGFQHVRARLLVRCDELQ